MKNNTSNEENFADMFEQSLSNVGASFKNGQMVETQVVSIGQDTVFLQLGGKSEGVVPREDFADKDGNLSIQVGDTVKVFFLGAQNGELRFTTRIGGEKAVPAMLEQAFNNQIPVEGVVEKEIKGGFEVKLGETRAFCPYSQMGAKRVENAAEYVGKHLMFKITEFKENGRNILVSNRAIHEAARQESMAALRESIKEGMVVTGTVKSIQDFGAFVDLGGVQALLPVSELGRTRVEDIRAVLSVGQTVEARVIRLDWKAEKITLSTKSLQADPWDGAVAKYPVDSKHTGTVARITDFGAFVTLEPGLDGLIHVSELRAASKYSNSTELTVKPGESVVVRVIGVDVARKRISLKPASSVEQDEATNKYMDGPSSGDTYNPFAALLKNKKK